MRKYDRYHRDKEEDYFHKLADDLRNGVYKSIGVGSGRIVYDLKNGNVVKKAKNKKGVAQNHVEYRISLVDDSGLLNKVISVSEQYDLLITKRAEPIENIAAVWHYFGVKNNQDLLHMKEIRNLLNTYDLLPKDFAKPGSWGMIKGRPVIIDYGFTRDVSRKYYSAPLIKIRRISDQEGTQ